jgi:hypothetical protein
MRKIRLPDYSPLPGKLQKPAAAPLGGLSPFQESFSQATLIVAFIPSWR